MYQRASGLDVHKESIVACVRIATGNGKSKREVRTFAAHARGLFELRAWLLESQVEAIAMEGTGVYWRPVYAVLELPQNDEDGTAPWTLIVGNAQHIKNVPGRKTDVKDAEWLAQLVAHGLIRRSFVPPPAQRQLRDLTRNRAAWVADRTRDRNRVLKTLQLAGVKLDGVASDAFGVSGMLILRALSEGKSTPKDMARLAKGALRKKIDALTVALESPLQPTHQQMLQIALQRLDETEAHLAQFDALIDEYLSVHADIVERLMTIPGVDRIVAACILAELGPDMSVFPTEAHAASWAGVCPGNHESAGKRSSGAVCHGNPPLKTMLCQAAHAPSHTKRGYLRDKFYRLKARRGHGRAIMAIAHKILIAAYFILKRGVRFLDLGDDYLDQRDKTRVVNGLLARLRTLGVEVQVLDWRSPSGAEAAG